MIVSIDQRQGTLIISYVNSAGEMSYKQLNIPPSHQYIYLYAKSKNGADPYVQSWDFKPVRKVPSAFLTKHRIQEFLCDAGEEMIAPFLEMNMPKLYSCDIEVDVNEDGFADAEDSKNRINTIAWSCYPNVTVFGLKPMFGEDCNVAEKKINSHLKKLHREYKFIYKQYSSESDMLYDFLYNYARKAPLITGWNFWVYDWRYIYNRCKRLNLDISWMSPTKQWYTHTVTDRGRKVEIMLPQHKIIVDYMTLYKKWDKTIEVKENDTLEFTAEAVLGIAKVKYPGSFQDLYKDFPLHVFYNAIDAILVEEIHNKINTLAVFLGLANINRVEAMNAFSPINMLEASLTRYAYKRNQVFPKLNDKREREEYEGAFVFKPDPGMYEWIGILDYASLYPSIIRQFKISIENFIGKDKNMATKSNEIKCSSGAIFDSSIEPLIPELLTDYYNMRKAAQNTYKQADMELKNLKDIFKKRLKFAASKMDI